MVVQFGVKGDELFSNSKIPFEFSYSVSSGFANFSFDWHSVAIGPNICKV